MLTSRVMRRVYAIWFLRRLFSRVIIKTASLALVVWQLSVLVSLPEVLANARSVRGLAANYHFWWSALFNTEMTVQILSLTFLLLSFWMAKDGLPALFLLCRRLLFKPF